jgi:hypothetical protein
MATPSDRSPTPALPIRASLSTTSDRVSLRADTAHGALGELARLELTVGAGMAPAEPGRVVGEPARGVAVRGCFVAGPVRDLRLPQQRQAATSANEAASGGPTITLAVLNLSMRAVPNAIARALLPATTVSTSRPVRAVAFACWPTSERASPMLRTRPPARRPARQSVPQRWQPRIRRRAPRPTTGESRNTMQTR